MAFGLANILTFTVAFYLAKVLASYLAYLLMLYRVEVWWCPLCPQDVQCIKSSNPHLPNKNDTPWRVLASIITMFLLVPSFFRSSQRKKERHSTLDLILLHVEDFGFGTLMEAWQQKRAWKTSCLVQMAVLFWRWLPP